MRSPFALKESSHAHHRCQPSSLPRHARREIYLPAYRCVLDHCLQGELAQLRALAAECHVVLLDYETNTDITDLSRPLSHASLIARYLADDWPA